MIPLPEGATCATCPWLADDWQEGARIGAKRCGFPMPAQFPAASRKYPRIDVPEQNGCGLHPRALLWARHAQPLLELNPFRSPEPVPEPPADPTPRRRAIRTT